MKLKKYPKKPAPIKARSATPESVKRYQERIKVYNDKCAAVDKENALIQTAQKKAEQLNANRRSARNGDKIKT